jgi:hypothetical protein
LNPFSSEVELFALVCVLYLYDCSVLLFANEALLTARPQRRWSLELGFYGFILAGRSLCILNPFTPQFPAFRLSWDFLRPGSGVPDTRWSQQADRLRRLSVTTGISAVALLVLLPLGLFSPLRLYALVPALSLLYGSAIVGLVRLSSLRSELNLTGARYAGFIFECLACPPFAANMVRRIALQQRVPESLPAAGARLLSPEAWDRLRSRCKSLLDMELERLDGAALERAPLDAAKRALDTLPVGP